MPRSLPCAAARGALAARRLRRSTSRRRTSSGRCSSRRSQARQRRDRAVFAGEVKPRHEADLALPHRRQDRSRAASTSARACKKGQVLARLDPADVGLQAEAAKAAVAAAETEYTFAQAEYERYQNLQREKFVSASALDAEAQRAQRRRAPARAGEGEARGHAEPGGYATLVATGGRRDHRGQRRGGPGRHRRAGGDAARARGRARGRDQRAGEPHRRAQRARSRSASFLWANPQKLYPARVREIAPAVDPVTRTFAVRVSILDADPRCSGA